MSPAAHEVECLAQALPPMRGLGGITTGPRILGPRRMAATGRAGVLLAETRALPHGRYHFMWSEGGWTKLDYAVAYAVADSPTGPFERIGRILEQDAAVATGAGHHSVLHTPGSDRWYIVYHRRPLGETDRNHRVVCIDELLFMLDGRIAPVKITMEGVRRDRLE